MAPLEVLATTITSRIAVYTGVCIIPAGSAPSWSTVLRGARWRGAGAPPVAWRIGRLTRICIGNAGALAAICIASGPTPARTNGVAVPAFIGICNACADNASAISGTISRKTAILIRDAGIGSGGPATCYRSGGSGQSHASSDPVEKRPPGKSLLLRHAFPLNSKLSNRR